MWFSVKNACFSKKSRLVWKGPKWITKGGGGLGDGTSTETTVYFCLFGEVNLIEAFTLIVFLSNILQLFRKQLDVASSSGFTLTQGVGCFLSPTFFFFFFFFFERNPNLIDVDLTLVPLSRVVTSSFRMRFD
jgi:hypothetical protein